jgi:hypothetical protein
MYIDGPKESMIPSWYETLNIEMSTTQRSPSREYDTAAASLYKPVQSRHKKGDSIQSYFT